MKLFSAQMMCLTCCTARTRIKVIPPKTTRFIQPLDVYFFRQYKLVLRRFEDYFRHKFICPGIQDKLHDRAFIIKLHSVVYHQFCSPVLKDMIAYAWQRCGYVTGHIVTAFGNALETLLTIRGDNRDCSQEACEQRAFVTYLYYSMLLWPDHFVLEPHHQP